MSKIQFNRGTTGWKARERLRAGQNKKKRSDQIMRIYLFFSSPTTKKELYLISRKREREKKTKLESLVVDAEGIANNSFVGSGFVIFNAVPLYIFLGAILVLCSLDYGVSTLWLHKNQIFICSSHIFSHAVSV